MLILGEDSLDGIGLYGDGICVGKFCIGDPPINDDVCIGEGFVGVIVEAGLWSDMSYLD